LVLHHFFLGQFPDEVDLELLGHVGVDGVEKFRKLYRAMTTMTFADTVPALKSSAANRLMVPWRGATHPARLVLELTPRE
jgi:hypothetical protein